MQCTEKMSHKNVVLTSVICITFLFVKLHHRNCQIRPIRVLVIMVYHLIISMHIVHFHWGPIKPQNGPGLTLSKTLISLEPRREKTGLRGFRPGPTQTGLYKLRKELEA